MNILNGLIAVGGVFGIVIFSAALVWLCERHPAWLFAHGVVILIILVFCVGATI